VDQFMQDISNFSDLGKVVTVQSITYCLIFSFLLSLAVAKTYQITYRGVSFVSFATHAGAGGGELGQRGVTLLLRPLPSARAASERLAPW
jgi:hypothetical protein